MLLALASGCATTSPSDDSSFDAAIAVNESELHTTGKAAWPESSDDDVRDAESASGTPAEPSESWQAQPAEAIDPAVALAGSNAAFIEPLAVPGFWSNEVLDEGRMAGAEANAAVMISAPVDPCTQYDPQFDTWLDRSQVQVYRTVCGATAWFDGFFGDRRFDQATGETYGRISVGGYWDELNGFDPRLRFRARFALPSLREKGSLIIGRGDEQDVIEERNTTDGGPSNERPNLNPNEEENVSTFVGFGWDQLASLTRGLRLSVGFRLRSPIVPIVKIKYRRNWQLTDRNQLSFRPLAYWRSDEGLGATLQVDIDHVINSAFLFRWANYGNVSQDEEVEGVDWGSTFYLYQAVSEKKALTYSIFFVGETNAPVTFQNTGFELRYRQRVLRDWLFIEPYGSVSWPRYLPDEERDSNFGVGLRLEAYFGPAPDHWMR